jgi:hypothetical protein
MRWGLDSSSSQLGPVVSYCRPLSSEKQSEFLTSSATISFQKGPFSMKTVSLH